MTFAAVGHGEGWKRSPASRPASLGGVPIRAVEAIHGGAPHATVSASLFGHRKGDRIDRVTQFTAIAVHARLKVPSGASEDQARRLLAKAEEACLVTNSLKVRPHLESVVEVEGP